MNCPIHVNLIDDEIKKKRDETKKTVSQANTTDEKAIKILFYRAMRPSLPSHAASSNNDDYAQTQTKNFLIQNLPVKTFSGDLLGWINFLEGFE